MLRVFCLLCICRWASSTPAQQRRHHGHLRNRTAPRAAEVEPPEKSESVLGETVLASREDESPMLGGDAGVSMQVPLALAGKGLKNLFDELRSTVVRIQAIVGKVDWLQPYQPAADSTFVGSGFVVADGAHPVFLTNAHVVQDARVVQVQLPGVIGQMIFEAYVPLICKKFDLALVQLKSPKKFWQAMRSHKGTMQALPMRDSQLSLGLEVAAVGFPLGSSSLKLSEGIISGTEMVDGTMNYQTTAPISPGSSGGPLFALDKRRAHTRDLKVIGVNFASSVSEGAQNVNYVVPMVHILQVLNEFDMLQERLKNGSMSEDKSPHSPKKVWAESMSKRKVGSRLVAGRVSNGSQSRVLRGSKKIASKAHTREQEDPQPALMSLSEALPKQQELPHHQLKIAPIDAIGIESSEALYNSSGGCRKGVFLSRILATSVLRSADPPVRERSFLTSVDGTPLDSFGMGRTANYLGDPTPFESLMQMRKKVDDPVTLTICREGKETKHVVTMRWRPEYNLEVRDVDEPHFDQPALDFEVFAGVTFMQMSMNHVMELLRNGRPQTLSRWLLIENQMKPRLIITHVEDGTYASRVLTPGMVVKKLNGLKISTLDEYRTEFKPKSKGIAWTVETDRGLILSVKFEETMKEQVAASTSSLGKHYLLSPAVLTSAQKMRVLHREKGKKEAWEKKGMPLLFATGEERQGDVARLHTGLMSMTSETRQQMPSSRYYQPRLPDVV